VAILHVKVVPGASRSCIVGRLGDALKVRVAAAAEKGKANAAVIGLLAQAMGLRDSQITILTGHTSARKTVQINGIDQAHLELKLSKFQ